MLFIKKPLIPGPQIFWNVTNTSSLQMWLKLIQMKLFQCPLPNTASPSVTLTISYGVNLGNLFRRISIPHNKWSRLISRITFQCRFCSYMLMYCRRLLPLKEDLNYSLAFSCAITLNHEQKKSSCHHIYIRSWYSSTSP